MLLACVGAWRAWSTRCFRPVSVGATRLSPLLSPDAAATAESRRYEISHPLYFARESKTWRGGVGFVDYTARAAAGQCTVSRIHLVTFEQFNGIVVQENSGNQASALPASTLSTLLQQGPGAHAQITPGWYGTIIYLGDLEDGHPVLSFSCSPDDLRRHVNPPSDAYMTVIMKGLAECGEERDGAVDYLTTRAAPPRGEDGMRRRLVAIASESHPAEEG